MKNTRLNLASRILTTK